MEKIAFLRVPSIFEETKNEYTKRRKVRKNESKEYNNRARYYMQFISISVPRPKNEKRITKK